jgi:hypothetical protein
LESAQSSSLSLSGTPFPLSLIVLRLSYLCLSHAPGCSATAPSIALQCILLQSLTVWGGVVLGEQGLFPSFPRFGNPESPPASFSPLLLLDHLPPTKIRATHPSELVTKLSLEILQKIREACVDSIYLRYWKGRDALQLKKEELQEEKGCSLEFRLGCQC